MCGIRLVTHNFHSYFVLCDKRKWGFEGGTILVLRATIALMTDSAGVGSCLPVHTRDTIITQGCRCVCLSEWGASLVPGPPRPAFVAYSTKSRGRPGRIYHVMRAAANVTFSLLTSGFVLSPSLFFPEFSSFFLFNLSRKSNCYWIDRG